VAGFLFHPAVLAAIVGVIANVFLAGSGKVTVRGINVFQLRVAGVEFLINSDSNAPAVALRAELIVLTVQLRAVVLSWFEERLFRLLILKPEVTVDHPQQRDGESSALKAAAPAAATPARDIDGLVTGLVRQPKVLRQIIAAARLVCVEVTDAAATENRSGGSIRVKLKTLAARVLYQAPPNQSTCKKGDALLADVARGTLRASADMAGLSVSFCGVAKLGGAVGGAPATPLSSPVVSFARIESAIEADLGARFVSEISLSFDVRAVCGIRALRAVSASFENATKTSARADNLPATTDASAVSERAEAGALMRNVLANSPRRMNIAVAALHIECIDDHEFVVVGREWSSLSVEASNVSFQAAAEVENKAIDGGLCFNSTLSGEALSSSHGPTGGALRSKLAVGERCLMTCKMAMDSIRGARFTTPVSMELGVATLCVRPDALSTICALRTAACSERQPLAVVAISQAPLTSSMVPASWPRAVRLHAKKMTIELVDLHGSPTVEEHRDRKRLGLGHAKPPTDMTGAGGAPAGGAAPIVSSRVSILSTDVFVALDTSADTLFEHYAITGRTARCIISAAAFAPPIPSDVTPDYSGMGHAAAVQLAAVAQGSTSRGAAGWMEIRAEAVGGAATGILDGRLRERLDSVTLSDVSIHEVAPCFQKAKKRTSFALLLRSSNLIITAAQEGKDLRIVPKLVFPSAVEAHWTARSVVRLQRMSAMADNVQVRTLAALFPPKPKADIELDRFVVVASEGGFSMAMHGSSESVLMVTSESCLVTVGLGPGGALEFSAVELAVTAVVGGVTCDPPLFKAHITSLSKVPNPVRPQPAPGGVSRASIPSTKLAAQVDQKLDYFNVTIEAVEMSLPDTLQLGNLIETFQTQDAAASLAVSAANFGVACIEKNPRSRDRISTRSVHAHEKDQATVSVCAPPARWGAFNMELKGGLNLRIFGHSKDGCTPMLVTAISVQSCKLNANPIADSLDLANHLKSLDPAVGASPTHSGLAFGVAMGSHINLKLETLVVVLRGSEEDNAGTATDGPGAGGSTELIRVQNCELVFKPIIATSLAALPNVSTTVDVPLLHLPPSAFEDEAIKGGSDESGHGFVDSESGSVVLVKDHLPMKVYADASSSFDGITITWGGHLMPSLDSLISCLDRLTPSAAPRALGDPEPPEPLPWWDNTRYLIHGRYRVAANDFSLRFLLPHPPPPPCSPLKETTPSSSRRRAGSLPMPAPAQPLRASLSPVAVFHFGHLEMLSVISEPSIVRAFQARPWSFPAAANDSTSFESARGSGRFETLVSGLKDARRDLKVFSVETLTVSVPSTGPEEWHSHGHKAARTQYLLALIPKLELTLALDWQGTR